MKVPQKTTFFACWVVFINPPGPIGSVAEFAGVYVAPVVRLGKAGKGHRKTTSVKPGKMLVLLHHGLAVVMRAELYRRARYAAYVARLGYERQLVAAFLLGDDVGDT